ncbi:hypothetical protein [Nonlabens agnitus]|uniref:Uncharacterized protein n=1 Tax=Nonlabens agnitus TaxID=870484 RepID=A0A2S9WRD5_9FLAO|nr:hypothetical protein [Nonlabens agnitus]PRP66048.1 hypothetical protein BST86_02585 [Nonlabens agnitus]
MKKHSTFMSYAFVVCSFLAITSCNTEDDSFEEEIALDLDDDQKLLQETAILFGKILSQPQNSSFLREAMESSSEDGDMISIGRLLNQDTGLMKTELENSKSYVVSKTANPIIEAFKNELASNLEIYPALRQKFESNNGDVLAKSSIQPNESFEYQLASQNLMLFYPYDPEYANDDRSVNEFMISYATLDDSPRNEIMEFDNGTQTRVIADQDNDFLDRNQVYVIVPIDDCDIPGRICTSTLLEANIYDNGLPGVDINPNGRLDIFASTDGLPTPINSPKIPLVNNYNHADFHEADITYFNIPRIKVNGTGWMGFGGTHQKLKFFRGTADGASVTVNSNGSITAAGNKYPIKDVRIKRKDVRNKKWININSSFDNDWDMRENAQAISVFSIHHISAEASTELTAKAGYKLENGVPKPFAEASGTVKITLKVGDAKWRSNQELSRKYVFANMVGNGKAPVSGKDPVVDNGVKYHVKQVGIVDFYFKGWYQDLTP